MAELYRKEKLGNFRVGAGYACQAGSVTGTWNAER